jgi:hypothetical protein
MNKNTFNALKDLLKDIKTSEGIRKRCGIEKGVGEAGRNGKTLNLQEK